MKYVKYIFIFFLILSAVYSFYLRKQVKILNEQLLNLTEMLVAEKMYNSVNKNNREFETSYNGKLIPFDSKVLDEDNSTILLRNIIDRYSLVLRFSDLHCNVCIDTIVNSLIKMSNDTKNINIILLVTSTDYRYISQFKKRHQIKFPVYRLPEELDNFFTDIDVPYFFVIEKFSMRINSTFVPLKENMDLTDIYFSNIIQTYFK